MKDLGQKAEIGKTWNGKIPKWETYFCQEKNTKIFSVSCVEIIPRHNDVRGLYIFGFNILIDIRSEISNFRWMRYMEIENTVPIYGWRISARYKSISRYGAEQLGFYHIYLSHSRPQISGSLPLFSIPTDDAGPTK